MARLDPKKLATLTEMKESMDAEICIEMFVLGLNIR
jgi:hypothetical protein